MERLATTRWWSAHALGEVALIVTPTNETARRLNQAIQSMRFEAWQLGTRYLKTSEGVLFQVGDRVVTRHNDRLLAPTAASWSATAPNGP